VTQPLGRIELGLERQPRILSTPVAPTQERGEERVFGLLYAQMCSIAGRCPDLEDLVQLAAERTFRALPSFHGDSELSTWTYRICYRTFLNERRWHKRWLARFTLTPDGSLPERPEPGSELDTELEQRERARRLHMALARVSPPRRVVVILHDLEGLEIDEIAAIVEVKPNTVRSRLRDGRKVLLRELMSDPYFGCPSGEERAR
jgi:RNA polymerase sigma-70 factor (ECF subfamily)